MGKNKKKNKNKAAAGNIAAASAATAKASAVAAAAAPAPNNVKPPPAKEPELAPAAPPAAAIEAEEQAPASPPAPVVVGEAKAAAPTSAPAAVAAQQEPKQPEEMEAAAPAPATPPPKATATATATEAVEKKEGAGLAGAEGEHAHLGPRSPPHLKPDVAKGFVQGGVVTLRLLEAEEHREAKGGQPYTTYAFRAYWGPELLHAKPWVVRRRYSEFVALDAKLRGAFPEQASKLLPLPPKTYPALLSWLASGKSGGGGGGSDKRAPEVIALRKRELEAYLHHIVANIPPLLRSAQFDDFLHMTDRIARIKAMGSGFVSCPCPPPPSEGAEGEGEWDMVASELSAAGKAGV